MVDRMDARLRFLVLAAGLAAATTATAGAAPRGPASAMPGFLTGPSPESPAAIATGYLRGHVGDYGLEAGDVGGVVAAKVVTADDSGATYVYLQQRHEGIEVYTAIANGAVTSDGRLIVLDSRFVGGLAAKVNTTEPALGPEAAAGAAAESLGLTGTAAFHVVHEVGGAARAAELSTGGVSLSTIPVRLVYQPTGGAVRLAWDVAIQQLDQRHWWNARVDAVTGELLSKSDYVDEDAFGRAGVADGSSYAVYAQPDESPDSGPRTVQRNPAYHRASAFGWHDTDGVTGPEFTIPEGNDVHAYVDADNDNHPDPGEPDVGTGLDFRFPIDLTQDPGTYQPAAVTNLFYWINGLHDLYYHYGFDEKSGNFQENDYGRGGIQNDSVQAEAQDGGGSNNSNFATPPDGQRPRMQLYLWSITSPRRDPDLDSGVIVHEYTHGLSNRLVGGGFGGCLDNGEQPGEGWSDWYALALTPLPTDTGPTPRGLATYLVGQTREEQGIRLTQYTTDMSVDPATYDLIKSQPEAHDVGYVWASILWEVYWGLVGAHGFNPDLFGDWTTGGNNLAIQLVTDGLRLTPCRPGFVDARDAIIAADQALTGGANSCILWRAFAKRGLGQSAMERNANSPLDGIEAFDVPSACGEPPATERVSVSSGGDQANADSDSASISGDGRFVAFASRASDLVVGDTNQAWDVFVHDRETGSTERVSVDGQGAQAADGGAEAAISSDGRFVAFSSRSPDLVPGDANGVSDVFVHDRTTGATERISVSTAGREGNRASRLPAISADGRFVAFHSAASNLVPGDTNRVVDVFVRDRETGTTERVSVDGGGQQGNGLSDACAISADGRIVAFESAASNLVAGDADGTQDIFVRDRQAGTTESVSFDSTGSPAGGLQAPAMSGDGRYVAFTSSFPGFVSNDTNGAPDVFVRDRSTGGIERASVSSSGEQAGAPGAGLPGISADGRRVSFLSGASNLVSGDTNGVDDVFVHDRFTRQTERASVDGSGAQANRRSLRNSLRGAAASADGRYTAFTSSATRLVVGDTNGNVDVFVRDRGDP
jgi:extracellular elastinolytic metalloproteinase